MTADRGAPFVIRSTVEDDWQQVRAIRLEMLADTPNAYLETLDDARRHPESFWRERARKGKSERGITLVAIRADGRWLGSMTCLVLPGSRDPWLVAVYVAPEARGSAGVTDALLDGIEGWARTKGTGLLLEVNSENPRAIAAYRKRGFVETGRRRPYPLDPRTQEVEMRKPLLSIPAG